MSKTIQLQFKNQTESTFEALSLKTNDTNIIVRNHLEEDQPILIEVGHELLNTQLDFSQIKSFYALYFNNENWFSGATISDSSAKGDFSVVTQSKTILLIPGAINFELGDVYRILF